MNPRTRDKSNNLYKLLDLYNYQAKNKNENIHDVENYLLRLKDCLDDLKAKWLASSKNKDKALHNFEKKIRLNFKSEIYINFFLTDFKFPFNNIKPLIPNERTLSNDDKRFASKKPFKSVEERKLDYYSILNGFNGFHCAKRHDFDISKKNPYEDFCREKISIDPDNPTIIIIQGLEIKGNKPVAIPEDLRKKFYDYLNSELYERNQKIKRFDFDNFQNALTNSIRNAYINVYQELYSLVHKLNTLIGGEKSKVLAGEFHEEMMSTKKKDSLKKRMYLRVRNFLESGRSEELTKGYDIDVIKAFIQLELKNYNEAIRILESNKYKIKNYHDYKLHYHDDLLLYETYKLTKNYDKIRKMENGIGVFRHNYIHLISNIESGIDSLKHQSKNIKLDKNRFNIRKYLKQLIFATLKTKSDVPVFYSMLAGIENLFINDKNYKENVAKNYYKAIDKGSININDYLHLVHFYWEFGSYDEVLEILNRANNIETEDKENLKLIHKIRAFIFIRSKEYEEARLLLKKIIND
ncbi:MAG: hypothetical protein JXR05_17205 [Flavobacteriaceae bacterium]